MRARFNLIFEYQHHQLVGPDGNVTLQVTQFSVLFIECDLAYMAGGLILLGLAVLLGAPKIAIGTYSPSGGKCDQ